MTTVITGTRKMSTTAMEAIALAAAFGAVFDLPVPKPVKQVDPERMNKAEKKRAKRARRNLENLK